MRGLLALVLLISLAGGAQAEPPKSSPRPLPRPAALQPLAQTQPALSLAASLPDLARVAPRRRADAVDLTTAEPAPVIRPAKARRGLLSLIAPQARPAKKAKQSRKGSVCGDPMIKGKELPRITSKTRGCGIENPVSITSVDGVRLSQPATINCPTAIALNRWVKRALKPAMGRSEVTGLSVVNSYSCRSRNNVRGAKISEHGRGNAIDISGIVLSNGRELSVERDFRSLRKAHKGACGIFSTTLGPGSDGYHEDHMHFDTAKHRSGTYCR